MARRIVGNPNTVPNVPASQVPSVPAPPYPAQQVPSVPSIPGSIPMPAPTQPPVGPGQVAPNVPLAPPTVPGMVPAPVMQAPPMEQQLQQALNPQPLLTYAPGQEPVYGPPPAPPAVPMTQTPPSMAPVHYVQQPQAQTGSPLHFEMSTDEVKVFKVVPAGTVVEAEITKAELTTSQNNNPQIKLQLRATFPVQYKGALFFDQVVLTKEAQWKYKSLCAACEDEEGNRLLSADNRFFTGKSEQDLVGNVIRFTADEPTPAANNPGTFYNKVKGGFESAFETFSAEDNSPTVTPEQVTQAAFSIPPPVPQFN